jgi:glycosyltransferase involved in cell wall biosynthesis
MKVALVHEWLTIIGGSENVFKEIAALYPNADIFTLVAIPDTINTLGLQQHKVTTSFIQKLPFAKTRYRSYLPLFPLAIEQFDLSGYDLIISSSHAVAKGVLCHSRQLHICYCHSPIRYAWDLYHQYLRESGLNKGIKGFLVKIILHRLRTWDMISTNRVDHFISNSNYIGRRIKKIYRRDSVTIYPNVSVEDLPLKELKGDYYVTSSRFVPYKKIDVIVNAFAQMPDKKLVVIGDGPDLKKVKRIATGNVELLGYLPFEDLRHHLSTAKAFVFAAEEDFGIIPVEAQACGTPVIAYGQGGVRESVVQDVTGVFFDEQTPQAIVEAVKYFENHQHLFNAAAISKHAARFSVDNFKRSFKAHVDALVNAQ